MLEIAYLNQILLKDLYTRCITKEEYKYYFIEPVLEYELMIDPSEWRRFQYVSKDGKGNILGYLGAIVNRSHNIVENIELINFIGRVNIIFSRDIISFFELLLCKRKFRKIIIKPLSANPNTKMYEKFIIGNGLGRKVGILKGNCLLRDGNYYDQEIYELYRENCEEWWLKKKSRNDIRHI